MNHFLGWLCCKLYMLWNQNTQKCYFYFNVDRLFEFLILILQTQSSCLKRIPTLFEIIFIIKHLHLGLSCIFCFITNIFVVFPLARKHFKKLLRLVNCVSWNMLGDVASLGFSPYWFRFQTSFPLLIHITNESNHT